ncbi:MAG: DUF4878 domain-containing protein [Cytophagales bacterium]|nr:DUF4878 domain-containing protein [Armatimonadota bacterium]
MVNGVNGVNGGLSVLSITATDSRPLPRMRWTAIAAACAAVAIALSVMGCGRTERQQVQTVSDQFLEAMAQEDWSRAKPLLTEKARDAMGNLNPFQTEQDLQAERPSPGPSSSASAGTYTVGEPNIEEESAAVPVTLSRGGKNSTGTLRLRREDGQWRVRALRIEGPGDEPGITLDFENPQAALAGMAFRVMGEGVGLLLKGVGQGMGAFLKGVGEGVAAVEKAEKAEQAEKASEDRSVPEPSPTSDSGEIEERRSDGS